MGTGSSGIVVLQGSGSVDQTVRKHSGAVRIECPESSGTTVHVSLPGTTLLRDITDYPIG